MNFASYEKALVVTNIFLTIGMMRFLSALQVWYPEAIPVDGFGKRFLVVPFVYAPMMKIMWLCMTATTLVGGYGLYIWHGSKMKDLFPMEYRVGLLPTIFTSPMWVLLMAFEQLFYIEILWFVQATTLLYGFVSVLKCRAAHGHKSNLGKLLLCYDVTVVQGMAMCTHWYWHCFVSFGTISIAYKDGPSDVAIPRGYCDPTDGCGYFLLPVYVLFVLGWILSDYVWWPQITNRVKLMYPAICYICIAVLINTPSFKKTGGLTEIVTGPGLLVHKTYVVLTLVSFTAWMFRGQMFNTPAEVKKEQ